MPNFRASQHKILVSTCDGAAIEEAPPRPRPLRPTALLGQPTDRFAHRCQDCVYRARSRGVGARPTHRAATGARRRRGRRAPLGRLVRWRGGAPRGRRRLAAADTAARGRRGDQCVLRRLPQRRVHRKAGGSADGARSAMLRADGARPGESAVRTRFGCVLARHHIDEHDTPG